MSEVYGFDTNQGISGLASLVNMGVQNSQNLHVQEQTKLVEQQTAGVRLENQQKQLALDHAKLVQQEVRNFYLGQHGGGTSLADSGMPGTGATAGQYGTVAGVSAAMNADPLGTIPMPAKPGVTNIKVAGGDKSQQVPVPAPGKSMSPADVVRTNLEGLSAAFMRAGLFAEGAATAKDAAELGVKKVQMMMDEHHGYLYEQEGNYKKLEQVGSLYDQVKSPEDKLRADMAFEFMHGEQSPFARLPYSPENVKLINSILVKEQDAIKNAAEERNVKFINDLKKMETEKAEAQKKLADARRAALEQKVKDAKKNGGNSTKTELEKARLANELDKHLGLNPESALQVPLDQSELKTGRYYKSPTGQIGRWTGKGFMAVTPGEAGAGGGTAVNTDESPDENEEPESE